MTNFIVIAATIFVGLFILYMRYRKTRQNDVDYSYGMALDFDKLFDYVKTCLTDLLKEENFAGMSTYEYGQAHQRRLRAQEALKKCTYGIDSAKIVVVDLIRNIIMDKCKTTEDILQIVPLSGVYIDPRIQFEILLHKYKKKYGRDALKTLFKKYNWAREKFIIEDKTKPSYAVEESDIRDAYLHEDIELSYHDMLDILATLIYQKYKGFGHVDTIHEMNINGYMLGTSGSILSNQSSKEAARRNRATNSCWLYLGGRYIHMRFIDFGSEEEIRRIVQLISRFNSPGQLTERKGYIINTMFDKSRVMAVRPPMSEYWAVFVRKFSLDDNTLVGLITGSKPKNAELVINMLRVLMLGQITTAVTGRQGSGKTTMMMALIEFMNPMHNIRTIETAFELYLRELYPERNILALQETQYTTMTQAQNILKKSDAAITMVGEVASDEIFSNAIEAAMVASLYTLFSHHAVSARDLIYACRNALVNAKHYNDKTAMDQALQVLHMDVHLDYDTSGLRYIARVTEIIPLEERQPYPELLREDFEWTKASAMVEFFARMTDRERFITRDLIVYDNVNHAYVAVNPPSEELTKRILQATPVDKKNYVVNFLIENWNIYKSA